MIGVEIIAIGNELLAGDVLDTNSHWLCGRLTGLGGGVRRATMVGDDPIAIVDALRGALARGARLIVTTGGLGPTEDDRTLESVAAALGLGLTEHPLALEQVAAKYTALARQGAVASAEMTPARAKMARLPIGAEPLANGVGAAPGVLLRTGEQIIVCLPGVPAELRDIFEGSLRPTLAALLGQGAYRAWALTVACGDESVLAPILARAGAAHAGVYIKSRARRFGVDIRFTVTLSARAQEVAEAESRLRAAHETLAALLAEAGITIVETIQQG